MVYDTEKDLWHEESAAGTEMVSTGQQLYLWDGSVLWAADPDRESGTEEAGQETALQFEAVSGDIGLSVPDDKYISRVTVRLDALAHTVVTVAASYDGGAFETLGTCAAGKDHQRINLPFVPRPGRYAAAEDLRHRADGAAQCGLYAGGGDRWAREHGTAEEMREGA